MNNDLAQRRSRIATGRELHRLNYLLAMTRMRLCISRSGVRNFFFFFFCGEIGWNLWRETCDWNESLFYDTITRIARGSYRFARVHLTRWGLLTRDDNEIKLVSFSLFFSCPSGMEQFEQLLTCAICLDRYRNPKLLPCQHSFCMEPCMDGLVDYVRRQVKCPECRAEHRIPYQVRYSIRIFPISSY